MKPKKLVFPRDGAAHDNIIEWWYFNGHLNDASGNEYSFMNCLFKAKPKEVKIPFLRHYPLKNSFFSHSILSDVTNKKFFHNVQPLSIVSKDSFSKDLFFVNYTKPSLRGFLNYEIEEIAPFEYHVKSKYFDLKLKSKKNPLLYGDNGFLRVASRETFFYSLSNLSVEGHVFVDGERVAVTGKGWFDHQWADVPFLNDKWTWFSIQLDNDTELMCIEYDNHEKKEVASGLSFPDGSVVLPSDVSIIPLGVSWDSTRTGANYPLSWRVLVPSQGIDLVVSPLIPEQEMIFGVINYWEGPLKVVGTMKGESVSGKAFLELVGYPTKKSFAKYYLREARGFEGAVREHFKS